MPSIQQKQQVIRSLIQNFDWETNPQWAEKWLQIQIEVKDYWKTYKSG